MSDQLHDRLAAAARAGLSRRRFLQTTGALGLLAGAEALLPSYARAATTGASPQPLRRRVVDGVAVYDLTVGETRFDVAGRRAHAVTVNGTVPGPLIRLREGEETLLRVTNQLREDTSIHWHGLLLPPEMDGVPGLSFPGILAGRTFEYRFPLKQYGTYWYHSHSGLQEQLGHYGPLVIEPRDGYPYRFDRELFVVLSDWTFENPYSILAKLKKQPDYYNFQKRTVFDFFRDVAEHGFMDTVRDRWMWAEMRMNPTDISDVTGATYTYLMNGLAPESNWTGLFRPGERVLVHFINASAATYFDVRIPGLPMTLVQASGQYVQPVETDELRIEIAQTYDVIVEPKGDRAYTVFAEAMDRSGFAAGTIAPRPGMRAAVPERRKRPVLTMLDMGMDHPGHGGAHGGMQAQPAPASAPASAGGHEGHDMSAMAAGDTSHAAHAIPAADTSHAAHGGATATQRAAQTAGQDVAVAGAIRTHGLRAPGTTPGMARHEEDHHGHGNADVPDMVHSRLGEPGLGLGEDGWRVLRYTDLRAVEKRPDFRAPDREIEIHLTGNMERFTWSIDGVPFRNSEPMRFTYGERIRLTMVNDTMMNHPMHLHGMWMELENGHGELIPRVHTVNVKPAERVSLLVTADAPGAWAFHCHVLYHMEVGMFRIVEVSQPGEGVTAGQHTGGHHHAP
jgi:CopA family copper-resistance protein